MKFGGSELKNQRIEFDLINEKFIHEYDFKDIELKIIDTIYKLRAVTVKDLSDILNLTARYIRLYVNKLYKNRFLERRKYSEQVAENIKLRLGPASYVYFLDINSRYVITAMEGIDLKSVKFNIKENLLKYEKVRHVLGCSKVISKLAKQCRENNVTLNDYKSEKFLWQKIKYKEKEKDFCPDLYFELKVKNKFLRYFVEYDTGSMSIDRFVRTKVPKYDVYALSGLYEEQYFTYPIILTLTSTVERAKNLADKVSEAKQSEILFLFTTIDKFYENAFNKNTFIKNTAEKKAYSILLN